MSAENSPSQSIEKYQNIFQNSKKKVAVVGAGVIGLSTAILAQEAGYNVTIFSDKNSCETTSAKAAASFKPHEVVYDSRVHEMVQSGWMDFEQITVRPFAKNSGVRKHVHWEGASTPKASVKYLEVMEDVEEHERPEVPGGYAYGWKYKTFFIDTSVYLPWLKDQFENREGKIISKKLEDPTEFRELPADIIFNCTGLGARELVNDTHMVPLKGQIVLLGPRKDMDWSISADGFYVYPRTNDTVLGGTIEEGVEDLNIDTGAIHLLLRGNKRILPDISYSDIIKTYAGLRPYRTEGVRIEAEEIDNQKIIHNYGHGGGQE